jgi:CheY-like chemotaxis protein
MQQSSQVCSSAMASRELEVDVASAVGEVDGVESVHALDAPSEATASHPDRLLFAVVLLPYTIEKVVETHYALLARTDHSVAGRILYVDALAQPPRPMLYARRLSVTDVERRAARERAKARNETRVRWLHDREAERAAWAAQLRAILARIDAPVTASLQGGAFEVVPDPFPSQKRPRILVADPDPTVAAALGTLDADVVAVEDGWSVVDRVAGERFDLVVCALRFDDGLTGAKIHRMLAKERADAAARIVFVAERATLDQAPPSSAMARVLARPIDLDAVRDLLARLRAL